jgi:glycosyltransferase involved in cell wall biosynthesis
MRAVIIDGDVSYPATSGKRLRTLHLMQRLAARHQITYVGRCAAGSEEDRLAPAYLRAHGIEPILVHDPVAAKSGPGFYARLACNLLSPLPYSVASHQSAAMCATVAELARGQHVDLWQCEWTPYLGMVPAGHPAPRLLMAHNVDTLIWQRYHTSARNPLKKLYIRNQWRKFERFERLTFNQAGEVVAVSPDDANLIATRFAQPNALVVENGFDRAYFEGASAEREPKTILFLGALDWRPNLDAVDVLLELIFPRVLAEEPAAKLWIVGRNPPHGLADRVARVRGAELHGSVPDVRPYLSRASVMAVPLRIGGGSRLKILEALACATPVVSTRVGAEGLTLVPGEHFDEADLGHMADALVASLREPARVLAQAERGRRTVLERYDWDVLALKLERIWERCAARLPRTLGTRLLEPEPCASCT